jgi:hypothetical protein
VNHIINPGLLTTAGRVKLNQYLCNTRRNGDSDRADSLYKNVRWIKSTMGESLQ